MLWINHRRDEAELLRSGVMLFDEGLREFPELVSELTTKLDAVAIERFTITMATLRKSRQPRALWMTGAFMAWCTERQLTWALQLPADAKSAFSDDMLRSLGMWTTSPHSRDATRHALLLARRVGVRLYYSETDTDGDET